MRTFLRKLLPTSARDALRAWVRNTARPAAAQVLAALHDPWATGSRDDHGGAKFYFHDPASLRGSPGPDGLPVPPNDWRQGYYLNDEEGYLRSGRTTADYLRAI